MATSITPSDLVVSPRNMSFAVDKPTARHWLAGDGVGTAWHNALSATFPQGERFFIQSVRRFSDKVPPALAEQIQAFVKQESHHTREHLAFNQQVADSGYDVAAIEARVEANLELAVQAHPVAQLCVTVALEHFTAIFAHQLLKDLRQVAGASEQARRMWIWHAMEEVEHTAVAFDTYMYVTRELNPLNRWAIRCGIFWNVSRTFISARWADVIELMAADGVNGPKARLKLGWYLLGYPGSLRRVLPMWASYFIPGFHPWIHDDRNLLAKAAAELAKSPEATA